MENVKEFFLDELNKLSGGDLTEEDKRHLNNCIRLFKNDGKQLEEMLELSPEGTVREYVRSRWDSVHSF